MNSTIFKLVSTISLVTFFASLAAAETPVYQMLEPLRAISALAANLDFVTRFVVFIIALALMIIALLAYKKKKSQRLMFIALAFLLFAVKWLLKVLDLYLSPGTFFTDPAENVFELLILTSLFIALFKK